MRLELWLTQLNATAIAGLRELETAESDENYRCAAERITNELQTFVAGTLLASCEPERRAEPLAAQAAEPLADAPASPEPLASAHP